LKINKVQSKSVDDYNRLVNNVNTAERQCQAEFDEYLEDCIYWDIYTSLIEIALIAKIAKLANTIVEIKKAAK